MKRAARICSIPPERGADLLQLRFERDEQIDWKMELHRRQTALKAAAAEAEAATEALNVAHGVKTDAHLQLQAMQEEQAERHAMQVGKRKYIRNK